jgi:hypothetical protein
MPTDNTPIYDAVIVGGGIAGLVTAYMLRDQNVLLLERTDRLGGKVETVTVGDTTLNIGTQFFNEDDTSFVRLIDELGVQRTPHTGGSSPYALHMDGQLRDDFGYLLRPKNLVDGIRLFSAMYRATNTFKLPSDDPRWREIMTTTLADLQQGYRSEVLGPVNTYMRGACVAKPSRTAGGMGALLTFDVIAELSFAEGTMASRSPRRSCTTGTSRSSPPRPSSWRRHRPRSSTQFRTFLTQLVMRSKRSSGVRSSS